METKHILVVDDNRSIVKALELVLKHEGFEVLTAFDGIAALESVIKDKPDLIILDIVMPRMNGYEVCRRLSQDPETKHIPVIILSWECSPWDSSRQSQNSETEHVPVIMPTVTGGAEDDNDKRTQAQNTQHAQERLHAFDVDATEFLTKPVIAKEVVVRVKQLLGLS